MMINDEHIIFVGGVPRSGTTLVQNMLDSHPDILGLPEVKHIPDIIGLRKKMKMSRDRGMTDLIYSDKDLDNYIRTLIQNIFMPLYTKYSCTYISEKTPQNITVSKELLSLFPRARFIVVVRDPRAVISSLLRVGERARANGISLWDKVSSLRPAIEYTKECFAMGFEVVKQFPERVYTVVYERLVGNPEAETKNICRFLNIDWSERMIYPGQFKHLGESGMTSKHNSPWYDKKLYNRNPEQRNLEQWKKFLRPDQQVRIVLAFEKSDELKRLGYEFSLNHLSRPEVMKAKFISSMRKFFGDLRIYI